MYTWTCHIILSVDPDCRSGQDTKFNLKNPLLILAKRTWYLTVSTFSSKFLPGYGSYSRPLSRSCPTSSTPLSSALRSLITTCHRVCSSYIFIFHVCTRTRSKFQWRKLSRDCNWRRNLPPANIVRGFRTFIGLLKFLRVLWGILSNWSLSGMWLAIPILTFSWD